MARFAVNHTLILSLLLVLLLSLLVPLIITAPKSILRQSKPQNPVMATITTNPSTPTSSSTTTSEIFGVKIEKNPPQSKLDELGVSSWPKYESPPNKIPWTFKTKETMYLLEGKVKVSVDGYEGSFQIGAGDLVIFPKGMKITWDVIEAINKHYSLEN